MKLRCLIVCTLLAFSSYAQRGYDTLPTMVEHYHNRYAQFKSQPLSEGKIIFLGNSITEGGDWSRLLGSQDVMNRGIGGDVTYGILNRLEEITRHKPRKIFLLIGINDIAQGVPDEVIVGNYKQIIVTVRAQSPDTQIILQGLLPLNPKHQKFPRRYNQVERVRKLNNQLKNVAHSMNVKFLDLYSLFIDENGMLDEKLTYDGLHLNNKGYDRWADVLMTNGWLQ